MSRLILTFLFLLTVTDLFSASNHAVLIRIGEGTNQKSTQLLVSNKSLADYLSRGKIQVDLSALTRREYALRGKLLLEDAHFTSRFGGVEWSNIQKDPQSLFYQMGVYYSETPAPGALSQKTENEKMAEFRELSGKTGLGPEYDLFLFRSIGNEHERAAPGFQFSSPRARLKEAERSFENYLINFPNGPLAGETLWRMALLHLRGKNTAEFKIGLAAYVDHQLEARGYSDKNLSTRIQKELEGVLTRKLNDNPTCRWSATGKVLTISYHEKNREIALDLPNSVTR